MSDRMEELNRVWTEKRMVKHGVVVRHNAREQELMKVLRATLDTEFGIELEAATKAEVEAQMAYFAEQDRVREQETLADLPYSLGTVLVGWEYPRFTYARPGVKSLRKTERRAVLQVYKKGDLLPANVRYSQPSVGSLVLRTLKKDGTVSAAVVAWRSGFEKYWFPEGVEPKNVESKNKE